MPLKRLDVERLGDHVGIVLRRVHTADLSVVLVEVIVHETDRGIFFECPERSSVYAASLSVSAASKS